MTERVEAGVTWTQGFNAENRLASVSDGTDTWTFVYDGDGNRVKQINPDGTISLFLGGGIYNVVDAAGTPAVTKYYVVAGQRVALSGPDGLQFILTDHLGSIAAVTDDTGGLLSEQRYLPFGGERLTPDIAQTDFGYTGQRDLAAVGLMDYNARWYDAGLARFTQPDTVIASEANPQSLNRYAYVEGNPTNFNDPSGNIGQAGCLSTGICFDDDVTAVYYWSHKGQEDQLKAIMRTYGVLFNGNWTTKQIGAVASAVVKAGAKISSEANRVAALAFRKVFNNDDKPLVFGRCGQGNFSSVSCDFGYAPADKPNAILFNGFYGNQAQAVGNVLHELGHAIDRNLCWSANGSICSEGINRAGSARWDLRGRANLSRPGYGSALDNNYWGFGRFWRQAICDLEPRGYRRDIRRHVAGMGRW